MPWGLSGAESPQVAVKQLLVPKLPQWLRGCHSWQPVRCWGVNSLWALFSFEEGTLQAGAEPAEVSDHRAHLELSTLPCGHGAHRMPRTGVLELPRGVQTPYIFKPKGHCRNLLCGLSLYDTIGRGCSCPAGLFAGGAVWSWKLFEVHAESRGRS